VLVKFWGVRGSIPVPGSDTVVFGGNTTCIEVLTSDNNRIIIDAGTGIRELGNKLVSEDFGKGKGKATLLFTHSHWDHIQGFPFFAPIYIGKRDSDGNHLANECNEFNVYGFTSDLDFKKVLEKQMEPRYFPVNLQDLPCIINYHKLKEGVYQIGKTKITARALRHPNGVMGFRIEDGAGAIAIATDYEHPSDGSLDKKLLELADNCDVLVYDGQYLPEEYAPESFNLNMPSKRGFGHSTAEEGVRVANATNAKQLIITHHDPLHDDRVLKSMEAKIQKLFTNSLFAKEGLEIKIK
jgi:phosphoribosyl 1,2-cyclic phosphodiesterase